jgi:hypothetical protein
VDLDLCFPFGDDLPVVSTQARRSVRTYGSLRQFPAIQFNTGGNCALGKPNQSLHPTVSSVTAGAVPSSFSAPAAPVAPAGELNRYTRERNTLLLL